MTCNCELTRGDYINMRAYAASKIVAVKARIPELEKLSRKTPPRTLVAEHAKVAAAVRALAIAKADLDNLEREHAFLRRIEEAAA